MNMRKIIKGDVNLYNLHLTKLLDLSDVEVRGAFNCSNNNLTSLEGCPHTVGNFICQGNKITSLKGAPHTVRGGMSIGDCNDLISLEGIPKTVGVNFFITKTLKDKFPEEYIRGLCEIKGGVIYF